MKENFTYGLKWQGLARNIYKCNLPDLDPTLKKLYNFAFLWQITEPMKKKKKSYLVSMALKPNL
jgi:hypothetical protein